MFDVPLARTIAEVTAVCLFAAAFFALSKAVANRKPNVPWRKALKNRNLASRPELYTPLGQRWARRYWYLSAAALLSALIMLAFKRYHAD